MGEPGVHEASLRKYGSKLVYHITVYFLFTLVTVDFKKAYDSVKREKLYSILLKFGIPKKLVRLIIVHEVYLVTFYTVSCDDITFGRHPRSYKRGTHSTLRRQRFYRNILLCPVRKESKETSGRFSHLDPKNYPRRRTHEIRYISLFSYKT